MARWRLTQPHYLNTIPPTKYRYEETDRDTGERNIQENEVPRLLDPKDPRCCRSNGDCVVFQGEGGQRGDWGFVGDPTPDMDPLDDEAQAISDGFKERWAHPMDEDALPSQGGFGGALLARLDKQLTELFAKGGTIPSVSKGVDPAAFEALQAQVAELMAKNAELQAGQAEPEKVRRA